MNRLLLACFGLALLARVFAPLPEVPLVVAPPPPLARPAALLGPTRLSLVNVTLNLEPLVLDCWGNFPVMTFEMTLQFEETTGE